MSDQEFQAVNAKMRRLFVIMMVAIAIVVALPFYVGFSNRRMIERGEIDHAGHTKRIDGLEARVVDCERACSAVKQ